MAISILGPLNQVINKTVSEIMDKQIIEKLTDVLNTFFKTSLGVVKELTEEKKEEKAKPKK